MRFAVYSLTLLQFLAFFAVGMTSAAQASPSRPIPITSIQIGTPISLESSVENSNDERVVLRNAPIMPGVLIGRDEPVEKLTRSELVSRQITELLFTPNPSDDPIIPSTTTLTLISSRGNQVEFTLPGLIPIDSYGYPVGLDKFSASAFESDQGVALSFHITHAQDWTPYSLKGTEACSSVEFQNVCSDAEGRCQIVAVTNRGTQTFEIHGQSKTESYSLELSQSDDVIQFDWHEDLSTETFGPCVITNEAK